MRSVRAGGVERAYRRVIEVEVCLADALSMVPLRIPKAKQSLLQEVTTHVSLPRRYPAGRHGLDILLLVPEGKAHVEQRVSVRHPSDPVLAPSVGPRPRVLVREVCDSAPSVSPQGQGAGCLGGKRPPLTVPCVTIGAVVFAH